MDEPQKKKRRKARDKSIMYRLSPRVRQGVDQMLADGISTYDDIAYYIYTESGHEISRNVISRYALNQMEMARKLKEAREMAQLAIALQQDNPGIDMTQVSLQVMITRLSQRVAEASDSEYESLTMKEVGQLISQLSRTSDLKRKMQESYERLLKEAVELVKNTLAAEIAEREPELFRKLVALLDEIAEREIGQ